MLNLKNKCQSWKTTTAIYKTNAKLEIQMSIKKMNVDLNKTNVKVEKRMLKRIQRTSKLKKQMLNRKKNERQPWETNDELLKRMSNLKNQRNSWILIRKTRRRCYLEGVKGSGECCRCCRGILRACLMHVKSGTALIISFGRVLVFNCSLKARYLLCN